MAKEAECAGDPKEFGHLKMSCLREARSMLTTATVISPESRYMAFHKAA